MEKLPLFLSNYQTLPFNNKAIPIISVILKTMRIAKANLIILFELSKKQMKIKLQYANAGKISVYSAVYFENPTFNKEAQFSSD